MQAATEVLVAIHKHLPGENTSVLAMVKQAAVCGLDSVHFMADLHCAGLEMLPADYAFLLSLLSSDEVHKRSP